MSKVVDQVYEPPWHERVDHLNDELHIVCRLLCKPEACMAAPEVMDVIRIAVERIHGLYTALAFEMRTRHDS